MSLANHRFGGADLSQERALSIWDDTHQSSAYRNFQALTSLLVAESK